jgi:hypothetical protein
MSNFLSLYSWNNRRPLGLVERHKLRVWEVGINDYRQAITLWRPSQLIGGRWVCVNQRINYNSFSLKKYIRYSGVILFILFGFYILGVVDVGLLINISGSKYNIYREYSWYFLLLEQPLVVGFNIYLPLVAIKL